MATRASKPLTEPEYVHPALVGLNEEQREAALAVDRPTLVVAPAGTGKTAVLAARYRYLLDEGLTPVHILALTFSNKAAGEMRERVGEALKGYDDRDIWIMTFHALGKRILESNPEPFGLTERLRVADEQESHQIMRECIRSVDDEYADDPMARDRVRRLIQLVDEIKTEGITPSSLAESRRFKGRSLDIKDVEIMEAYDAALQRENMVDYNDLILKPLLAFRTNPDFAHRWRRKFKAVSIDEYQDTNKVQYQLLRILTEEKENVLFLGDDDQLIFAWRGASNSYVLDFEQQWPNGQIVKLRANYRNAPAILEHARMLINHNDHRRQKDIVAVQNNRGIVEMRIFDEPNDEQAWIADQVMLQREKKIPLDQIAILTRTRDEATKIALTLAARDIPHYYPDNDLLKSPVVRGLVKWGRIALNTEDRFSMMDTMAIPDCGLTSSAINSLSDFAVQNNMTLIDTLRLFLKNGRASPTGPVATYVKTLDGVLAIDMRSDALFRQISEMTGLDSYAERESPASRDALRAAVAIFDDMLLQLGNLRAVLDAISLNAQGLGRSQGADPKVQINTMHASKGLEFSCIIAPGWEEGHFPYDTRNTDEIVEARRLAYVTMTRARDTFLTTVCRRRPGKGNLVPSRFLSEAGIEGNNL